MKLKDIQIPTYSRGEEIWNSISHGLGAIFAIIAGTFALIKASGSGDAWKITTISIYVFSMLLLYTMSCLYHALSKNCPAKKILRVLDHTTIYLLIAGTYTPFCLVSLRTVEGYVLPGVGTTGWVIFSIMLVACVAGIIFSILDLNKYKHVTMVCNLVAGWSIIIAFATLIKAITLPGALYLLAGGVAYSLGAILYGIGKKHAYMHTVFHFFVLLGSILQFISIYFFVL